MHSICAFGAELCLVALVVSAVILNEKRGKVAQNWEYDSQGQIIETDVSFRQTITRRATNKLIIRRVLWGFLLALAITSSLGAFSVLTEILKYNALHRYGSSFIVLNSASTMSSAPHSDWMGLGLGHSSTSTQHFSNSFGRFA